MMARKNLDCSNNRTTPEKYQRSTINNNYGASKKTPSPRVRSPEIRTSPRQSPGLIAGHYAGCKWSEPPSPSTLPTPPQHWMQQQITSPCTTTTTTTSSVSSLTTIKPILQFHNQHDKPNVAQFDIASQLKMLLKVQA